MTVSKNQGDVGNGGFNSKLGNHNPTPPAMSPSGKSLKHQGVTPLSTRFPYVTKRGEIKDHQGL